MNQAQPLPMIAHYRLLEPLGRGAMGEVWLAEDTQLPRKVAVKLLPLHLSADPDAVNRLMREAQAAASIDHPGVVTVYDAGIHEGRPYLVMQRVEGETMEARLQKGPMPIEEALDILHQAADALAEVHALGIIHRDLKTANIMITPRGVKILDFGIASVKGSPRLTSPGTYVGTPLAMSPEQLRGLPPDNRSDLWALGVILYEALTGRLPFGGDTFDVVAYAILNQKPESPGRLREGVGPDLDYIAMKLLRKDPEQRYARAEELLADLTSCDQCLVISPPSADEEPAPPRVAVLYFEVMSADPDDAYLAAGLTEDLITDLMRLEGLRVASRAEVVPLKDRQVPPRTIGRELGVDYVVMGSVRRAGNRARISAQLVRASDGHTMWAERFDRTLEDLFDVQSEVSQRIVSALQVSLRPGERELLEKAPTRDPRAYAGYLQALELFEDDSSDASDRAERLLLDAVARDPEFALAHAALADCYSRRMWSDSFSASSGDVARASAERALALCPDLPDAHIALARVHFVEGDAARTLEYLDRLIRMDPDRPQPLEWAGWAYNVIGCHEVALETLQKVVDRYPERYAAQMFLQSTLEFLGRTDEMERRLPVVHEALLNYVRRHPTHAHARSLLALNFIVMGHPETGLDQARIATEIAPSDLRVGYNLVCTLAKSGRKDEAMNRLLALVGQLPANSASRGWFVRDPDLSNLHEDPRFIEFAASGGGAAP